MIPALLVKSRYETNDFVAKNPNIPVITIRGAKDPGPQPKPRFHAEIICDDITQPTEGYTAPNLTIANNIWNAWEQAKKQHQPQVIIHCEAGVSRSTAAALGIFWTEAHLAYDNHPESTAVDHLLTIRPHCTPNPTLLALLVFRVLPPATSIEITQRMLSEIKTKQPPITPGQIIF